MVGVAPLERLAVDDLLSSALDAAHATAASRRNAPRRRIDERLRGRIVSGSSVVALERGGGVIHE